jgi:hypothetical protein
MVDIDKHIRDTLKLLASKEDHVNVEYLKKYQNGFKKLCFGEIDPKTELQKEFLMYCMMAQKDFENFRDNHFANLPKSFYPWFVCLLRYLGAAKEIRFNFEKSEWFSDEDYYKLRNRRY